MRLLQTRGRKDDDTIGASAGLYAQLTSLLPRTGWLQRGVARPESYRGAHLGVAALALFIGGAWRG
jgi:hypothetical protein